MYELKLNMHVQKSAKSAGMQANGNCNINCVGNVS